MAKRIKYNYHHDGKLPINTKLLTRSKFSKYHNPYPVKEYGRDKSLELFESYLDDKLKNGFDLSPLKGMDLACICELNEKCHVDIILNRMELLGIN